MNAGYSRVAARLMCLLAAGALAACASVPDSEQRQARKVQAGLSADSGWASYERGKAIAARAPDARNKDFLARHQAVEEAISGAPLVAGNDVHLLADGPATYRAMLESIAHARRYVHMETYIFDDDEDRKSVV